VGHHRKACLVCAIAFIDVHRQIFPTFWQCVVDNYGPYKVLVLWQHPRQRFMPWSMKATIADTTRKPLMMPFELPVRESISNVSFGIGYKSTGSKVRYTDLIA